MALFSSVAQLGGEEHLCPCEGYAYVSSGGSVGGANTVERSLNQEYKSRLSALVAMGDLCFLKLH